MSDWQQFLRQLADLKQEKTVSAQVTIRIQKAFAPDKHPSEGFIAGNNALLEVGKQFRAGQITQRRAVMILTKIIVGGVSFPESAAFASVEGSASKIYVGTALENAKIFLGTALDIISNGIRDPENSVRTASLSALHEVLRKFHQLVVAERLVQVLKILQQAVTDSDSQPRIATDLSDTLRQISTEVGTRAEQQATESAFKVQEFVEFLDKALDSDKVSSIVWLLKWIEHVSKLPRTDLVIHLPEFIEKLFKQIAIFPDVDVPKSLNNVLWPSVASLQGDRQGSILSDLMLRIVGYCNSYDLSTRNTALGWVSRLLDLGQQQMFPLSHEVVGPILEQISSSDDSRILATRINENFQRLVRENFPSKGTSEYTINFGKLIESVLERLQKGEELTRLAALRWVVLIHDASKSELTESIVGDSLFISIVSTLHSASDDVLRESVSTLVEVAGESKFGDFIRSLLLQVSSNAAAMLVKLPSIVLQLQLSYQGSNLEHPEMLFMKIAEILPSHGDKRFICKVVNSLHMMMLTLKEMLPLRTLLRRGISDEVAKSTFSGLFTCWAFDPVAAVGLCLLSSAFDPALDLVEDLGRSEVTATTLVQLDRLAQLFESPVFAFVRTGLLKPRRNAALLRTLFGIQMILPQSSQPCKSIRARLKAAPTIAHLPGGTDDDVPPPFDRQWWNPLFQQYQITQQDILSYESRRGPRV